MACCCRFALGVHDEFGDHRGAVLVLVERGEIGGELVGQHGEVAGGGIDGLGLMRGVLVDGGVLRHGCRNVGHADAHTDAAGDALGPLDLIEIARGVVVDRGPEQAAQIAHICRRRGRRSSADARTLSLGSGWKSG